MRGYVQIYTGNGKGKTTAALGLALRAAGRGLRCFIGQFMKGQTYGELTALKAHPCITIEQFSDERCLLRKEDVTDTHIRQANDGLQRCIDAMTGGTFDLVVLDEVNVAVWFGLLKEEQVLDCLALRPPEVEVVLTGRYASDRILAQADLVTEMRCVKHYYDAGVSAREGIER